MLLKVARKSLLNRKFTVLLTILSIAVSVFVLIGVEHIRHETKSNFTRTLSGTDLVVGARTGEINLLLYSIFRIGNATNNISWDSYKVVANSTPVKWSVPISLGDSHKGYRVLGTTVDYFTHYKYANKQSLTLAKGNPFRAGEDGVFDVVLGAEVAKSLGYDIGAAIVLAHGISKTSFNLHDDKPFKVVGILAPTGTPVDQTLHVSLEAIEAIHLDWHNGAPIPGQSIAATDVTKYDLEPSNITAFMLGLHNKVDTFTLQRDINEYPNEALMAILPGATLATLWNMIGSIENVLRVISLLVLLSALIGMSTMLLSSLRERARELAILRAVGASPLFSLLLIELEVLLITIAAIFFAIFALFIILNFGQGYLLSEYGVYVSNNFFTKQVFTLITVVIAAALALGLIPAVVAYRQSLQQGLTVSQ